MNAVLASSTIARSEASPSLPVANPATKLRVLISHALPMVSAGLASTLERVPECEVRVWDDELRRQYGSQLAVGANIVLSDLDQAIRLLLDYVEHRPVGHAATPTVLVVTPEGRADTTLATQRALSGATSPQRPPQGLIEAFRRLASSVPEYASPHVSPPRGGMAPGGLRRTREYIERQIAAKISLRELAKLAGLSPGHFSRAFRQSVGMPPHRYVQHRRIEAAAKLIRDTNQSLTEIALGVGFADQSHFTRVFMRARGETPAVFRRRHR